MSDCECNPSLRRVLCVGNRTCGCNIVMTEGDKILGKDLVFEGKKTITLESPQVKITNQLLFIDSNAAIKSSGDLELDIVEDFKLNVGNLTGQVTGNITLSAVNILHNTPNIFSVLAKSVDLRTDDIISLSSQTDASLTANEVVVVGAKNDIDGITTLAAVTTYINAGSSLNNLFPDGTPPLTFEFGGANGTINPLFLALSPGRLTTTVYGEDGGTCSGTFNRNATKAMGLNSEDSISLNAPIINLNAPIINLNGSINASEDLTVIGKSSLSSLVVNSTTEIDISAPVIALTGTVGVNGNFSAATTTLNNTTIDGSLNVLSGDGINLVAPAVGINGDLKVDSRGGVTITAPTTTIDGNLMVTGQIINPTSTPAAFFSYITSAEVDGGPVVISSGWNNLQIFNEVNIRGLPIYHQIDGGIRFEEPGTYHLDGFTTFYSENPNARFISRFSNLSGIVSSGGFRMGTSVFGQGLSTIKGLIEVIDVSLPWYFQYKTNISHLTGLGRASGLDLNIYSTLDIIKI